MQINNNIAALNAWRNLGVSTTAMSKSLEKLSSGYRINRGSDDPAGLLISEQLKAQISSMDQATRNASDAISMVQTAEGALTEMNNMLNSIRSLAVHAANTGANDANSIAADQTAVDKAVESMQRIATTTKYGGKNLLDGSAGSVATIADPSKVAMVTVGQVNGSGDITINVTTSAQQAELDTTLNASAGVFSADDTVTVWLDKGGTAGTVKSYAVTNDSTTVASIADKINADSATTHVWASANGSALAIVSCDYGSTNTVHAVFGAPTAGAPTAASATGIDIAASIDGDAVNGSGLILYGSSTSAWSGTTVTLGAGGNVAGADTSFSIAVGSLQFSLTDNASKADLITYAIQDMRTSKLGLSGDVGNINGLNDIITGGADDLSTNAANAVKIIDAAINSVSTERANLGAFQKYTLETTINNLGVTKENLSASESRIRDVDMAAEMMEFTKNQILVQAGTAMLAQANQLPQSVLKLLQG